jgi:hypothetical protein
MCLRKELGKTTYKPQENVKYQSRELTPDLQNRVLFGCNSGVT